MSGSKGFTGQLAPYMSSFLAEKRSLGFKYHEQERMLHVLDHMSGGYDCSTGLPKELCGAFVQRQPNWRQATQEGRVSLIRKFAEYLLKIGRAHV